MEEENLTIEPGDFVSYYEDGKVKGAWLTVLEVDGEKAICSIRTMPENMDERPSTLPIQEIELDLKDLRLIKKA